MSIDNFDICQHCGNFISKGDTLCEECLIKYEEEEKIRDRQSRYEEAGFSHIQCQDNGEEFYVGRNGACLSL